MIAVLGVGRMGGAIGSRLTALGHDVIFGCRAPGRDDVISLLAKCEGKAKAQTIEQACSLAETIILATPYSSMTDVIEEMGDIEDKIIIDVTNALAMAEDGLMKLSTGSSAGEELQLAKPSAKVVKALNTVGFHVIMAPDSVGGPISTMLAGNDAGAKQSVAELVQELGFEAVDVGPIRQSRYLEGMSALYLTPYLQGRAADAFEFYLRTGSSPKESKGVRAAG